MSTTPPPGAHVLPTGQRVSAVGSWHCDGNVTEGTQGECLGIEEHLAQYDSRSHSQEGSESAA